NIHSHAGSSAEHQLCLHLPVFFRYGAGHHRDLHSFPTRRSSDLDQRLARSCFRGQAGLLEASPSHDHQWQTRLRGSIPRPCLEGDRKSTRLNSSHDQISYAVFCLKKKKIKLPAHDLLTVSVFVSL